MRFEINIPRRKVKEIKEFLNFNLDCEIVSDVKAIRQLFLLEDRRGNILDLRGTIGNHFIVRIKKIGKR